MSTDTPIVALSHFADLLKAHSDAVVGSGVGLALGLGVHEHAIPGMDELPLVARILLPVVCSILPVIGKALWSELRPAGKGAAAGMRTKARLMRDRADKMAAAGDVKGAESLLNGADNLDAAAAAIDAAES